MDLTFRNLKMTFNDGIKEIISLYKVLLHKNMTYEAY